MVVTDYAGNGLALVRSFTSGGTGVSGFLEPGGRAQM